MRGLILTLATLGILLGACGEEAQVPNPKQRVYYSHYWSFEGTAGSGMEEAVASYNAASKTYELIGNALDHEAFKTAITADLDAGRPADIYSYWAGMRTSTLVDKLQPIDELWERERLGEHFSPSLVESAVSYDGHKYLLPITQHLVAMIYDRKLFQRLGLNPPATWDEFLRVCETIRSNGVTPLALGARHKWPSQFWFDYLLLRTAGPEYRQHLMLGKAAYTDPQVMRAFALWKELVDRGFFNPDPIGTDWDTGAGRLLVEGRAAMTLMGSWLFGYLSSEQMGWVPGRDFGMFPFPAIEPGLPMVSVGPVDGLIVPRDARNPEGAMDVLRHFTREDVQLMISRTGGNIVPRLGVDPGKYPEAQKIILPLIGKAPSWAFNFDLAARPDVAELGLNAFTEFLAFPDLAPQILQRLDAKVRNLPHE
ncbi:MAG: hypothetical protein CVU60_05070 [Deltaproteobacteria bacterium HGW-Deltaproteobacteria-18]|jgi:multiple sugar transport system substrate-binding protein/raffinose/stachyose/melibiose transport system substrate-binding protein|nr:MAG: hypothetical protein CVU60_05070 [Deltaproteobacteria bacterium HGW-Deltaproteobacteria-18]